MERSTFVHNDTGIVAFTVEVTDSLFSGNTDTAVSANHIEITLTLFEDNADAVRGTGEATIDGLDYHRLDGRRRNRGWQCCS